MYTTLRIIALLAATVFAPTSVGPTEPGRSSAPNLPEQPFHYTDLDLPDHFVGDEGRVGRSAADNTPPDNPTTDDGATLGRVLFYDTRLSANDTISCGSCHLQAYGFSDPRPLSVGLNGETTRRHSMALANAGFYSRDRFFWDERADSLEEQTLMPIQDPVEMGMSLTTLESRLAAVDFYPGLFEAAFGTPEISSDRIARALAQFVRSLVSYQSRYDEALMLRGEGNSRGLDGFDEVFTEQELLGLRLFGGVGRGNPGRNRRDDDPANDGPPNGGPNVGSSAGGFGQRGGGGQGRGGGRGGGGQCSSCHTSVLQVSSPRNNGLDAVTDEDDGAGRGRFKAPSLRNIAVRAPYMHDGRFATLREVIEHYNSGVQLHPDLARELRARGNRPRRLNLDDREIEALVAFLGTLTDETFLSDPKFSDPFAGAR